ncbi:MAG: sodium:calcium antiporter [Chloroflexi bacterium]|nr:sodium:calcium antiporter [Chloroflexota bacterium]
MELDLGLPAAIGVFLLCATAIIGAAILLAQSSDVIADKSGWGRLWVGALLLAGATSLPETVTAVSAVRIGAPAIAAGNIFGANMLNVSNLAIVIALLGSRNAFQRIVPHQVFLLGLALVMTGTALFFALVHFNLRFAFISPAGLVLLGVYAVGSRFLYRYSNGSQVPENPNNTTHSLKWGIGSFSLAAVAIFVAAPFLAGSTDRIAELTGLSQGFVGVLFVSLITTLPELTATVTAVRIGAYDLAISGMYGSNAFNVAALGLADFFSPGGSLFSNLGRSEIAAGGMALLLMGLALVQLRQHKPVVHFSLRRPNTAFIVSLYLFGLYLVYSLSN